MRSHLRNLLAVTVSFFTVLPSGAATFTVTNANDSGTGSLRQAILDANAAPGADVIEFDPVFFASQRTITLTSGALAIEDPVSINGPGTGLLTIHGNASSRIFRIDTSPGSDVSISNLVLTGGSVTGGGGAIETNEADLTLDGVLVSGNSSTDAGGAIDVIAGAATLLLTNSTFTENATGAEGGGAIYFAGTGMTIENSTLSGNDTTGSGGAIYVRSGTVAINHVTIAGNTADSDNTGGGSGGGLFIQAGTVTLQNGIVATNSTGSTGSNPDVSGAVSASSSYNLIGIDSGLTGISNGPNGNQIGTAASPIDPMLGPLADNGGETPTRELLEGSPAIDAADPNSPLSTDQRGEARPQGAQGDAGAFELAQLTIDDVTQAEGTNGTTTFTFTISRGTAILTDATVQVDTANGTAIAPGDYTAIDGQVVTIPGGSSSATVDVTVVADAIDELSETFFVNLSNPTNAVIAKAQGVGTIVDDDTAGFTVTPTAGLVTTEAGGTDTFTVVLTSQPVGNVVIDVASSDATEGRVSTDGVTQTDSTTLTFTAANWSIPQTVTVHGQDDDVVDGDQPYTITLTMNAATADAIYLALDPPDVSATNEDDDGVGVIVSPTSGLVTTEAGGSSQFTIVLAAQPLDDVVIDLSSSDTTEGTVLPESVTFTSGNWNTARTITVTGVDDDVDDGDVAYTILTSATSSADLAWHDLAVDDVSVTNQDDDTAGVVVTPTAGLTTTEAGATATFTIVLTSEPTADVIIDLSSSNPNEGLPSPASLTFTSADWNLPQTVTVTGVDDFVADGDVAYTIVTAPAVSADPAYDGMTVADVSVTSLDDETSADDSDGDGVLNTVEDGGPNGGDGNEDGIADSTQPHVATFPAANGNGYITLISTCELREVVAVLKDGFEPPPVLLPYALVEFRLPCASADLTVLYHAGDGWDPGVGYWKYGPETPGQELTTRWYELPGVVFDTTTVAGNTVARASFTLNDGQLGDDTGVDGEIVDQGGPGAPVVPRIPTVSEWMLLMMAMALAIAGAWKLRC